MSDHLLWCPGGDIRLSPQWKWRMAPEGLGSTKVRFLTDEERVGTDDVAEIAVTLPVERRVHYEITGITTSDQQKDTK